jgi:hypothetical protein
MLYEDRTWASVVAKGSEVSPVLVVDGFSAIEWCPAWEVCTHNSCGCRAGSKLDPAPSTKVVWVRAGGLYKLVCTSNGGYRGAAVLGAIEVFMFVEAND